MGNIEKEKEREKENAKDREGLRENKSSEKWCSQHIKLAIFRCYKQEPQFLNKPFSRIKFFSEKQNWI